MGRPKQIGLSFFSFDVDFHEDDKIALIEEELDIEGTYVLVRLLCAIYKNGYYYDWSDDACRLFVRRIRRSNIDKDFVDKVVNVALRRDFFDKVLFERFKILTSHGIQKRYLEATRRYKEVSFNRDYLLVEIPERVNVKINGEQACPALDFNLKDKVFEIFFFKNFPEPALEVERFFSYYEGRGWLDSNNNPVSDKIAVAEFWEPKEWKDGKKDRKYHCPTKLLTDWKKVYDRIKENIGENVYQTFLRVEPQSYSSGKLTLGVRDKKIYEIIENEYLTVFKSSLQTVYGPNIRIEYIQLDDK